MRGGEGAEIVYPLRTSSTLPSMILDEIGNQGQIKRKIYQRVLPEDPSKDYYYIMRETPNTTALLIEYGFIDNVNDQKKLQNNLLDYVEGVVKAVSNYIGINYILPGEENSNENVYIVKSGDTLYQIAKKYDITVNDLKNINNLVNDNLFIGQSLKIPSNKEEIEKKFNEYIVKSGDTLYQIAKNYNISVNDLIEYNELSTTILQPGQVIQIPIIKASDIIYTVKKGDTLYSIALNYNITPDEIKKLNNLTSNTLSIGQELYIPEGTIIEEINYVVYQVLPGDTLYSIAKKYNVSEEEIKEYNNLNSNLLTINQILQIPVSEVVSENIIYTVKKGDTLYQIANNYGLTVSEIMNLNNLNTTLLNVGDILLIPNKLSDY